MRVYINGKYEEWQKKKLKHLLLQDIDVFWGDAAEANLDYEILICGVPDAEMLARKSLKKLVVPYAGIPAQTRKLIAKYPHLELHNLHHNALPTAEMAFSLLLAAAKNLVTADRKMRTGDWTPRYEGLAGRLMSGRRILILGLGAVGKILAELCLGMKMKVWALRRHIKEKVSENGIEIFPAAELDRLLPQSQYLAVTLPLTTETEGILNRERLLKLPPDAVLVNIGRGQLIVEKALFELLQNGHLGAAALDVWYNYPKTKPEREHTFPSKYPFHTLDNVVMSPHRGGSFANYDTEYLRVQHLAELLNSYKENGSMPNKVDTKLWY